MIYKIKRETGVDIPSYSVISEIGSVPIGSDRLYNELTFEVMNGLYYEKVLHKETKQPLYWAGYIFFNEEEVDETSFGSSTLRNCEGAVKNYKLKKYIDDL